MINKLRSTASTLIVAVLATLALVVVSSVSVSAQITDQQSANIQGSLDQGSCLSTDPGACDDAPNADEDAVNNTVALVINIFSWIVGVISVIMIIFGGFKYITSGGDSSKITDAKNTILYALIGLIIVALSQVIVRFVLGVFTTS